MLLRFSLSATYTRVAGSAQDGLLHSGAFQKQQFSPSMRGTPKIAR
jgi:hypothetical protein